MTRSYPQYANAIRGPLPTAASAPSAVRTWPALLAGIPLAALATLAPHPAHADEGTWTGGGRLFPMNGPKTITGPRSCNTETFTNNDAPASVTISNAADINTIEFTPAAPAYSFSPTPTPSTSTAEESSTIPRSRRALHRR